MDVLPVQASAVPCERVFSSSKETNTMRRSRMSPELIEVLQILKFSFRQEHLNFHDAKWNPSELSLSQFNISEEETNGLMAQGKLKELLELLHEQQRAAEAAAPISFPIE